MRNRRYEALPKKCLRGTKNPLQDLGSTRIPCLVPDMKQEHGEEDEAHQQLARVENQGSFHH